MPTSVNAKPRKEKHKVHLESLIGTALHKANWIAYILREGKSAFCNNMHRLPDGKLRGKNNSISYSEGGKDLARHKESNAVIK